MQPSSTDYLSELADLPFSLGHPDSGTLALASTSSSRVVKFLFLSVLAITPSLSPMDWNLALGSMMKGGGYALIFKELMLRRIPP